MIESALGSASPAEREPVGFAAFDTALAAQVEETSDLVGSAC